MINGQPSHLPADNVHVLKITSFPTPEAFNWSPRPKFCGTFTHTYTHSSIGAYTSESWPNVRLKKSTELTKYEAENENGVLTPTRIILTPFGASQSKSYVLRRMLHIFWFTNAIRVDIIWLLKILGNKRKLNEKLWKI